MEEKTGKSTVRVEEQSLRKASTTSPSISSETSAAPVSPARPSIRAAFRHHTGNIHRSLQNTVPALKDIFPFDKDDLKQLDLEKLHPRNAPLFPRSGFIGLFGSLLTLVLTAAILLAANNRHAPVPWGKFGLAPNSILSGILSLNSFCLSMAFAEGATIAWWYHAAHPGSTPAELHQTWSYAASKRAAFTAGRRINYVALATVFVALVPINGIVMQSALTTTTDWLPMKPAVLIAPTRLVPPMGFSASINDDHSVGALSDIVASSLSTTFGSPYDYYVNSPLILPTGSKHKSKGEPDLGYPFYDTNCEGFCTGYVRGFGLWPVCEEYSFGFDISGNVRQGSAPALSVEFGWNFSSPNTIGMDFVYKNTTTCAGNMAGLRCNLHAAIVNYPVAISSLDANINSQSYREKTANTQWTLDLDWKFDNATKTYFPNTPVTLSELLPVQDRDGAENTTWGGIADVLKTYYGSSCNLTRTNGSIGLSTAGLYAKQNAWKLSKTDNEKSNVTAGYARASDYRHTCNCSMEADLHGANTTTQFFNSLHSSMLYMNLWSSFNGEPTDIPSTQFNSTSRHGTYNRYSIRWRYYCASVVITLMVVLTVAPTFWGFWTLTQKASLSPLDTARAFAMPTETRTDVTVPPNVVVAETGPRHAGVEPVAFSAPLAFNNGII